MKAYIFSVICALWFIYITLPHLKSMSYNMDDVPDELEEFGVYYWCEKMWL